MKKLREKISNFVEGIYGIDDLGKVIIVVSIICQIIGSFLQNTLLLSLAMAGLFVFIFRVLSHQHWERNEENIRYSRYVKLWKLRYERRKESRIFMCSRCGRYIHVPKGRGKIQVTCTACGAKTIKRT